MSAIATINPSSILSTVTCGNLPGGSSNHILDASLVGKVIPTNQWWANAILQDNADPVFCFPYIFKCQSSSSPAGLAVGLPAPSNTPSTYFSEFSQTINLTMAEAYGTNQRTLMSFDDMGFKMRWLQATNGNYFESYLYRGQTTIAVYYNNVTPKIDTGGGVALTFDTGVTNTNYIKFHTNQSPSQTWVIQTPTNQSWTTTGTTAQMTGAYTGWVFYTYIPTGLETNITNYVGAVVTGVSANAVISGSFVNWTYTFTVSSQITGKNTPLVALLTHHYNRITNQGLLDSNFNSAWSCIRGPMYGLAATSATFQIPLITTPTQYEQAPTGSKLTTITSQLATDKSLTVSNTAPYEGGKEMGKLATLVGIAELISDSTSAASIRANIKTGLTAALDTTGSYKLVFDTAWSGVYTSTDAYGNTTYNDHHFHWGYWLYAAGMLAKGDTSWFSTSSHQDKLNLLARDIGNPDPVADIYFPKYRHMDLYEFHSWAHGVVTSGDGKDQESDTEAINAYYGLALWGQFSGNTVAQQAGQILLSTEVEGVKNYYHLTPGSPVMDQYNGAYKHTLGLLFMGKIDYATFFDGHNYAIHGIHNFPITPVSVYAHLSDLAWVYQDYCELLNTVYQELSSPNSNSWYHFIIQALATFQSDVAWTIAQNFSSPDDGTTLTNIWTFIATRPARKRPPCNWKRPLVTRASFPTRTLVTRSLY